MRRFISDSGDLFEIPEEQYEQDVAEYNAAVEIGDESTMLYYETGMSGWIIVQ